MLKIDKKEIVKLTCDLIKKKTVNPPGNEYLCEGIVAKAMKKLGMAVEIKEKGKGRTNVIGKIGRGSPKIALITHMDVVPGGEGWKTEPFKPVIKGGKIYGRGALDNKGCFAVSFAAIKAFLEKNKKFKGTIFLVAAADEEKGSELGVKYLLSQGFKPDFALIPDGGMMKEAIIGEKGCLWLKITSFGKQAHGSTPQLGINAIEKLSKLIAELKDIDFGKGFHPAFEATTLNIGQISGGQAPNMVPAKAEIKIDIRFPLGITKQGILKKIQGKINDICKKDSQAKFKIEQIEFKKPHLVKKSSLLIKKFQAATKELNWSLKLKTVGGITVGKELYFSGIPAIAHYPCEKEVAHMANEYVKIENLVKCARLYALVLEKLLKL